ncbi:hypothetical protein ATANTOWER_028346 [Ataeniobius toweri]|uniref:NADH dehydrogenase subunit 4 n=1 Tax=Ataeniobius toweri TaxID=208326 RepID=A0ABU7A3A2_9TELE|nr:hypothetical protein [Ataeniobius toweri]
MSTLKLFATLFATLDFTSPMFSVLPCFLTDFPHPLRWISLTSPLSSLLHHISLVSLIQPLDIQGWGLGASEWSHQTDSCGFL